MIHFMQAPQSARANHSEATSAAIAMTTETTTSPQRRGIAIRRLDQRIDRRRNGLGLAGNIRHEGNGRAEFADTLSKAPTMRQTPGSASGNVTV